MIAVDTIRSEAMSASNLVTCCSSLRITRKPPLTWYRSDSVAFLGATSVAWKGSGREIVAIVSIAEHNSPVSSSGKLIIVDPGSAWAG